MQTLIIAVFFSFLLSNYLFKIFSEKSPKIFLDIPNNRSMHKKPKPRGAGIIFILLTLIASFFYMFINGISNILLLPLALLPLSIIGLIDDLFNLKPKIKYIVQLITSILLFFMSNLFLDLNLDSFKFITLTIFITISITAVINFLNFMDGIDGMVASCILISISTSCIVLQIHQYYLFLIITLLTFIFWNWYPAKIFMGDVGSTFLSAINIGLILQSNNYLEALSLLMVLGPCLIDPFVCVIRRFFYGEDIFSPHKLHLYQRLKLAGIREDKICFIYISFTCLLSLSNIFFDIKSTFIILIFMCFFGFYLEKKKSVPFAKILKSYNLQK